MRLPAICLTMLTAVLCRRPPRNRRSPSRSACCWSPGSTRLATIGGKPTPAIRKVLEEDKRFDVRIVEDPEFLASSAVSDYDVIFLHFSKDDHPIVARARRARI